MAYNSGGSSLETGDGMPQERIGQRRYDPQAVQAYIVSYQAENAGRSPSQRQIQRALYISAPSVVHMILRRLERRGLLTVTRHGRGYPSDLTLTDTGRRALEQWQQVHPGPNDGARADK